MSVFSAIVIGLAIGLVFGFALEKSRVFEPGIIVGQMQLRNFLMLKVFLSAVITGLVVLAVLNGVFGVKLSLKPLLWQADILGGLLLGIGIALAGACPGTALAQLGAGYRDAPFIIAGGIAGAMVYGYNADSFKAYFAETGAKIGFNQLLDLPYWPVALAAAGALAGLVAFLERQTGWQDEVGPDFDGVIDAGEPAPEATGPDRRHA